MADQVIHNPIPTINTNLETLNNKIETMFTRERRTYTNITIPSSEYIKIDSYEEMGVNTSLYVISITIRGWSGSIGGVTATRDTNGTNFYLTGPANKTIPSITIDYVFSRY